MCQCNRSSARDYINELVETNKRTDLYNSLPQNQKNKLTQHRTHKFTKIHAEWDGKLLQPNWDSHALYVNVLSHSEGVD